MVKFLYSVEYKGNIYRDLTASQLETTLESLLRQYPLISLSRDVEIHAFWYGTRT